MSAAGTTGSRVALVGIGCSATAWSWASGSFGPVPESAWWALLVPAFLMLLGAPVRLPTARVALVVALAALAAAALDTGPRRALWAALTLGGTLAAFLDESRPARRIAHALLLGGAIGAAQLLTLWLHAQGTARLPRMPGWAGEILAAAVRAGGVDAAYLDGEIAVFAMRETQHVAASWNLLCDPITCSFVLGSALLLSFTHSSGRYKALGRLAAVSLVWIGLRAALLLGILVHQVLRTDYDAPLHPGALLHDPWWNAAMAAPLLALACMVVGRARATLPSPAANLGSYVPVGVLAMIAAVCITFGATWRPSGATKGGRVLVDEHHCQMDDWTKQRWRHKRFDTTSTLRVFDPEWFGDAAAYNYATLFDYCSRFFTMSHNLQRLDEAPLAATDVLVLKVPSHPFTPAEVEAVRRFVERGGGLLLVGEHTSVFGSGVCLNQVARQFGFAFRYDCLFQLHREGPDSSAVYKQRYTPPRVPHPVVQRMGPLDFAVSCSIDPGLSAGDAVILGTGLRNADADYFSPNFYPQPHETTSALYGAFVQLWSTRYGAGRVLAFTDSTIFANFSVCEPGKRELFLGMLQWLNHQPTAKGVTPRMLWSGGLLSALLALLLAGLRRVHWSLLVALGALGHTATLPLVRAWNARTLQAPVAQRPLREVVFETSWSTRAKLPRTGFVSGKDDEFGLFERAVQRLTKRIGEQDPGETWVTARAAGEAALHSDAVVCIWPNRRVPAELHTKLVHYVGAGGKLLVLDSVANTDSTSEQLLSPFGLRVHHERRRDGVPECAKGLPPLPKLRQASEVEGGTPLVRIDGTAVGAWIRHGKGAVVVLGFADRFTDAHMGISGDTIPNDEVRSVRQFEYGLLRRAVADALEERR
ncbi:MAG: hypothetical protein H6837_13005 [Planctomycetes bacterium]|nr:hypothetical protein [Planctomycetota bacterium]